MNSTYKNTAPGGFEEIYFQLRSKEQRMYSDAELIHLPEISVTHPYYKEWQLRKKSAGKLIQWLLKKKQPLHILEVGCGNGWLAKLLAGIPGSEVTGSDINYTELQQGAKVFAGIPQLHFIYGDIRNDLFDKNSFDCIVFAASLQYFPSLQEIITAGSFLLKAGGEIHILDTPLYKQSDVAAAKKRTADYYNSMGMPDMATHYFHHSWQALEEFDYQLLHNPASLQHFFSTTKNPFPWICIKRAAVTKRV